MQVSKFCKDCKHYEHERFSLYPYFRPELHLCFRKSGLSLVTGEILKNIQLECYAEREDALRLEHFRCGVDAKYFEMNMENK